jgi:hypothetical protein
MSHFCLYSWASAHHKIMFRACTLHTQFPQNCTRTSNLNFSEEITPGTIMIISTSLHWSLQSEFQNHAEQMYLICLGHPTTRVRSLLETQQSKPCQTEVFHKAFRSSIILPSNIDKECTAHITTANY